MMSDTLRPPWTVEHQTTLSSTVSGNLLRLMFIESVKLSNLTLCCHPLLLPLIFPCTRVFSNELALCIRWPKHWIVSFSISPSHEYSGLIAFRVDCFYLLAVQGTLQSVLKPTVWKHQFFGPSPSLWPNSHPYNYWRNHSLTIQTFVGKVMSLLFNMLSRFVIAFLPRSKCLLTLGLQSLSTVILETKKIKFVTVSTFSQYICHEVMGLETMIFVFRMLSFKWAFSLSFPTQFSSVIQSSPTLCDHMNCRAAGFPVYHQLLCRYQPAMWTGLDRSSTEAWEKAWEKEWGREGWNAV